MPPSEVLPSNPSPLPDGLALLLLRSTRHGIDRIDDDMLRLLSLRRRFSAIAGRLKQSLRHPMRDPAREHQVLMRARHLAQRLRLPQATAQQLTQVLITDARQQQAAGTAFLPTHDPAPGAPVMTEFHSATPFDHLTLLHLIPPPSRWKPLLHCLPGPLHERVMERVLSQVLAQPGVGSTLEEVSGRRLGIHVTDLDLRWVFHWQHGRLHAVRETPEASVRGSATDLLLLASRLEDADTLFFQRRLLLTGDIELGLTVRNLLDRMPWEAIPLSLRILLQRSAELARAARAAYRGPLRTQAQHLPGSG